MRHDLFFLASEKHQINKNVWQTLAMMLQRDNDTLVLQLRELPREGETPVMNVLLPFV